MMIVLHQLGCIHDYWYAKYKLLVLHEGSLPAKPIPIRKCDSFRKNCIPQFLRNVEQVDVHTAVYVGTLAKHSSSYFPYNHLSVMAH